MPETWPPVDRGPTGEEIRTGQAVVNDDGTVSWSPTEADFYWADHVGEET